MKTSKPLPWNVGRRKVDAACMAMVKVITGLTDRELEAFLHRVGTLDQTNCWWLVYQSRGVLSEVAKNEQQLRRDRRAQKATSAA